MASITISENVYSFLDLTDALSRHFLAHVQMVFEICDT